MSHTLKLICGPGYTSKFQLLTEDGIDLADHMQVKSLRYEMNERDGGILTLELYGVEAEAALTDHGDRIAKRMLQEPKP